MDRIGSETKKAFMGGNYNRVSVEEEEESRKTEEEAKKSRMGQGCKQSPGRMVFHKILDRGGAGWLIQLKNASNS